MATIDMPPAPTTATLAQVLANGNDAGSASITAHNGAQTIWDATTSTVPQAVQGGPAGQLSGYPLKPQTDVAPVVYPVAQTAGVLLTSTAATTVLTYTPAATGLLDVKCTVNVTGAATNLTLTAAWTDPTSGAQTYTWYNQALVPVGATIQLAGIVRAAAGQPVTVTAQAGTVDQVTVAATLSALA
jgi:hypothetical protein